MCAPSRPTASRSLLRVLGAWAARSLLLLAVLGAAGVVRSPEARAGDDVLKTYKKRFKPKSFLSERESVFEELAACGEAKALSALLWCIEETRERIADLEKDVDKAVKAVQPVRIKYSEKLQDYIDQQHRLGKPTPTSHPAWPVALELRELEAEVKTAERHVQDHRDLLKTGIDAHGRLIAGLPDDVQASVREDWTSGALVHKDWRVRARQWGLVGGVQTPWALDLLVRGVDSEADPRALIHVLDGLGGRDPAVVVPLLAARCEDPRWLVRTAAVAALERTPSKETVDALVKLLEGGEGRSLDDARRALVTLSGRKFGINATQWRKWWDEARAEWVPPEPKKEDPDEDGGKPDPDGAPPEDLDPDTAWEEIEQEREDRQTGFFGLDTRSKRVVYVIDVSGSMQEAADPKKGKETRADLAKKELERSVLGLDDDALFNIVFYSSAVRAWRGEMQAATQENRRAAVDFIRETAVGGGTATYDALEAAMEVGDVGRGKKRGEDPSGNSVVDTIILLSDGQPTIGKITDPRLIRAAITELNVSRRIAVHTVAFGADANREFMEGLAKDTGGTHVSR